MTLQILINIVIALVWMLLHDQWEPETFIVGYAIGLMLIFVLRRFFPSRFYLRRLWAIIHLFYLFNLELIKSTIVVARQVTRPKLNVEPGIYKVKTKLTKDWEITLLSMLITLTPGSVVMEVIPAEGILYIHAMDETEFMSSIMESKRTFEKAILEVTR